MYLLVLVHLLLVSVKCKNCRQKEITRDATAFFSSGVLPKSRIRESRKITMEVIC